MPEVVATKLIASRSQQSSEKAARTFLPFSQPISKPSEHQRVLRRRAHRGDARHRCRYGSGAEGNGLRSPRRRAWHWAAAARDHVLGTAGAEGGRDCVQWPCISLTRDARGRRQARLPLRSQAVLRQRVRAQGRILEPVTPEIASRTISFSMVFLPSMRCSRRA